MKSTSVKSGLLLLSCFLCGCNSEQSDLTTFVATAKQQVLAENKQTTQSIPVLPKPVTYQHAVATQSSSQVMVGDPLKSYPVASYVFTGTLTQDNVISAYVLAPDKMVYQVKQGDTLGNQQGQVSSIQEDHIEITEISADNKQKVTSLQLKG